MTWARFPTKPRSSSSSQPRLTDGVADSIPGTQPSRSRNHDFPVSSSVIRPVRLPLKSHFDGRQGHKKAGSDQLNSRPEAFIDRHSPPIPLPAMCVTPTRHPIVRLNPGA
ncbi:hypothetical protein CTA2_454 [Colletotrichum tanaceti]|uniref:Uncharacterized protein n=1 Tax=Colletotrichum tanaceti TaxID=1306861 RepID=A0A4U6XAZ3_9PEZI|nr:hypothetical protein CTA2_454 [Colletotrichum tanaceti]TKW52534.1 hypothetical protein CTA1_13431 [Colletotrichum tanaceti]